MSRSSHIQPASDEDPKKNLNKNQMISFFYGVEGPLLDSVSTITDPRRTKFRMQIKAGSSGSCLSPAVVCLAVPPPPPKEPHGDPKHL